MSAPAPAPPPPAAEPFDDRLTFPPFPHAPPGVTIIPFKDFKERGIQMFATGDDQEGQEERDGLGIPTVELRVKHNTDTCKTETKRKRRKAEQARKASGAGQGARKEWWELWMENEDLKMTGPYNPHTSSLDRLYEAAADFRKTRTWPPGPTGISAAWDQFRLFVGLLSNTPVWTRTDKPPQDHESDSDNDDEAEFEAKENTTVEAQFGRGEGGGGALKRHPARARARPPYALYGVEPIPVGSDEEVKALLNGENARREEQMVEFLNDPEMKIKIFLSSYMRKQGLIWQVTVPSDKNLINIPHLLEFFIRFLLRNRVFPEVDFERALKRSLDVIGLAQKELILTSKIPKQLADDLNKAFRACWGQKADGYKPVAFAEEEEEKEKKVTSEETKDDERDAKRIKLDTDALKQADPAPEEDDVKMAVDKFEEELKAANVEVIKVDDDVLKNAEKLESIRDNLNPDIDAVPTWAADSETQWGDNDDTWGPADNDNDGITDQWKPIDVDWAPPAPHTLFPWLGPTALPLTHTAGVVECSVRRIKSFTAPPAPGTLPKSPVSADGEPEAVEVEFTRHFAKVVLGPWTGWDAASDEMPHMAVPRILETSRGMIDGVVGEDGKVGPVQADLNAGEGKEKEDVPERRVRPHDPLNDDITVLVEPAVLPMLSAGLGLGGTWVQIAREEDFGGERKKKKGKSKNKKVATRYWYIDELMLILPSFHT